MKMLWCVLFILFIEPAQAITKNIHVEKPGTFADLISEEEKFEISKLVISGDLNGSDIRLIREMAGCEDLGKDPLYKMIDLDLSNANIVSGGDSYLEFITEIHYTTNNQIGPRMFQSSNLHSIKLPYSILTIDAYAFQLSENLAMIDIPNGVTTIGVSAFHGCSALDNLDLPESVTKIEAFAFENCYNLKSIILPSSLKNIEGFSFSGCTALTSVIIPDQVTTIPSAAFAGCLSLKEISFPEAMTTIMNNAFENCSALQKIYLPEAVNYIKENAFANCIELVEIYVARKQPPYCEDFAFLGIHSSCVVNVPYGTQDRYAASSVWNKFNIQEEEGKDNENANSGEVEGENYNFWVKHSDGHTYYLRYLSIRDPFMVSLTRKNEYEPSYSGEIVIPETVAFRNVNWKITEISPVAFTNCKELKRVTLNKYIDYVTSNSFSGCNSLEAIEVDEENKKYYSQDGVLYDQKALSLIRCPEAKKTLLEIPDGIKKIEEGACSECAIEGVNIPNTIKIINHFAFSNCNNIGEVTIPESVVGIGMDAFSCKKLKTVHLLSSNPPSTPYNSFKYSNTILYVPKGCIDVYKNSENWDQFRDIREEGGSVSNEVLNIVNKIQILTHSKGVLLKANSTAQVVYIYRLDGKLVKSINVSSDIFIPLSAGIYVLVSDFDKQKIIVR